MLAVSGGAGSDVAASSSDVHLLEGYSGIMLACQGPVLKYHCH
jgi:hypothetical protein